MNSTRLKQLLDELRGLTITVAGDFALDKYLYVDTERDDISMETGLRSYQISHKKFSPGGAANIVKNMRALGVGDVRCIGVIGDDGEGFELMREMNRLGANTEGLVAIPLRQTTTYMRRFEGSKELNRIDFTTFEPIPEPYLRQLCANLKEAAAASDAVMGMDYMQFRNDGVICDTVRRELAELSRSYPGLPVCGDSRRYTWQYDGVIIKCNDREICGLLSPGDCFKSPPVEEVERQCRRMYAKTGRPLFITLGKRGMMVYDGKSTIIPTMRIEDPIDICGAGDSAAVGVVAGLALHADYSEAALLANLIASITIQQIGTTGEASPEQVLARLEEYNLQQEMTK